MGKPKKVTAKKNPTKKAAKSKPKSKVEKKTSQKKASSQSKAVKTSQKKKSVTKGALKTKPVKSKIKKPVITSKTKPSASTPKPKISTSASSKTVKILEGEVSMDYKWAPGPSVGKFLASLRDSQEILAVRCPVTSRVYLPIQAWSPYANVKMDRTLVINTKPKLKTGTIVYEAPWNAPEGITLPYMLAAIQFVGADTELLHLIVAPEDKLKALKEGSELKIKWRETRSGTIRDIDYFEPA